MDLAQPDPAAGGSSSDPGPSRRPLAGDIAEFQAQMRRLYGERDRERGLARTHAWFVEECGELARALFRGDDAAREHEFADVLAWLASLADQAGVDLARAAARYADGCPRCGATPCTCTRP